MARVVLFALITHSVLGGVGACSPRTVFKFKTYESTSEAIGDHHNHTNFMATGL